MNKLFRVKIIGYSDNDNWYKDMIGSEFIVQQSSFGSGEIYSVVNDVRYLFQGKDVEVLCEVFAKTVYVDIKPKTKKCLVVYKRTVGEYVEYGITLNHYASIEEFKNEYAIKHLASNATYEFSSFIEDSMIEVQE